MFTEIITVPVIVTIVYWIIELIKLTTNNSEKFKRFIPLTAAGLGIIIALVCFYCVPNTLPTDNVFVAIIIGAASGLTAVGVNQTIKQLTKE